MEFLSFRKNDKFVNINDFGSKLLNDSISSEFDLMSNFPKHFIFKSRHRRMVRPWIGTVQSYNHVFVLKNSLGCRLKPISDQKPHPQILFSMNVFRIQLTIWTLPIYNHWKVRVLMKWKCSFDKSLVLDGKVTTVAATVGSVSYFSRSAFSSIIYFKTWEIHGRETFVLVSQDLYSK